MRILLVAAVFISLLGVCRAFADGPAKPSLRVELLPDSFGEDGDFLIDDMPVPVGGRVRIAYVCHGENELAKASVLYRVLLKPDPGKKPAEKEPWLTLPLAQVKADDKAGPFNAKTGVFAKTKFDEQVPFHALPVADLPKKPLRTLGGGRVFLNTDSLVDGMGKRVQLRSGDQIETCVEVTERARKPDAKGVTARSPTRITSIVTVQELQEWVRRVTEEDRRLRELKRKQKDLFKEKQS